MIRRTTSRLSAFTLIEVLVVVAIIALLISILLPSLAAAREQAQMVACQANLKSIATAFVTFSSEHKGRLPGVRSQKDLETNQPVSWIGDYYDSSTGQVIQPAKGALWRHMGRQPAGYICPTDSATRGTYKVTHSYCFHSLLSGANTEWLAGAHRLKNAPYKADDHTGTANPLVPFEHVPMLVEEDFTYLDYSKGVNTNTVFDGSWANEDGVTDRHMKRSGKGWGSIAFADTHVGRVQLPHGSSAKPYGDASTGEFFQARDLCIRTRSRWISGRDWKTAINGYGALLSLGGDKIQHRGQ